MDDVFEDLSVKHKDLNNNLLIPSYRKFCDIMGFGFNFWDQLPAGSYSSEINKKQLDIHIKAMTLFNKMKPDLVIYKNEVVEYSAVLWSGEIDYKSCTANEFFKKTSDELFCLRNFKKRYKAATEILLAICCFELFILITYALSKSLKPSLVNSFPFIVELLMFLSLGLSSAIYVHVIKRIDRFPKKPEDDGRYNGIIEQINTIYKELDELNGIKTKGIPQTFTKGDVEHMLETIRYELSNIQTNNTQTVKDQSA